MMRTALSILRKDLRMEFRSKESILAMWIFSLLIFVIFNFTFEVSRLVMLEIAPGLLWVAFVFSGMFGLNQSFALEKENGNLRAMALMPVDGGEIYIGKFLSVTIIMLMFEALIFPIFIIFYDLQLSLGMFRLVHTSGKIFVVQGQRLWIGDYSDCILKQNIDIDFTVSAMESFYNGAILFTDKGMKRVDDKGQIHSVENSDVPDVIVKGSCKGSPAVYAVGEDNTVIRVVMIFDTPGQPFAKAVPISAPVSDVSWGDTPKLAFCDDILWIARESDIYGFSSNGWTKNKTFDGHTIDYIVNYKNKLAVSFYDTPDFTVFDPTIDFGSTGGDM